MQALSAAEQQAHAIAIAEREALRAGIPRTRNARSSAKTDADLLKIYGGDDPRLAEATLREIASQAGLPKDSLDRFLASEYVPQPQQVVFHAAARSCDQPDGPEEIGFGGARGGGKSKGTIAQIALDDCLREHELKFLFLRKVGKAARESFEDLRRQTFLNVPHDYQSHRGIVEFKKTGSRIFLGHFRNDSDIDAYLGLEYDGIAIEEDTQLSAAKKRDIKTCLRTSKPTWRPRMYRTTNPGGVDHAGFKQEFIMPWRSQTETNKRFIPATVADNVFVNPEYTGKLEALTGWLREAWLHGNWDIAAGQYFSTWDHDAIVKKNLRIMPGSEVWCSLDYGFQHPTVCYLFSRYDGKTQLIDEHWRRRALVSENANDIKNMLARYELKPEDLKSFVAGKDVFDKDGKEAGKTIADEYEDNGIQLTRANMDRINGAAYLLKLLGRRAAQDAPAIEPQIEVSDRCPRLIENIPTLQHDPNRPEDVLKVDIDEDGNGGDDPYDACRYGLMVKHVEWNFA